MNFEIISHCRLQEAVRIAGRNADVNAVLQINPVFETIIPELSPDEFAQLEENIVTEQKIIDPIITWKGMIVDGHNRYKIAQKHPEIPFSVHEKKFDSENEVVVWICSHQLGRRNINEIQRKCLFATRYESEKKLDKFRGNQHTLTNESGCGPKGHDHNSKRTRVKMAEELGVSEKYLRNSVDILKGVNAADEAVPGVKKELISGQIKAFEKEIIGLAKLPIEERVTAIELLRNPKKSKSIEPETYPHEGSEIKPAIEETSQKCEIEENILGSMQGSVDLFISTYNNYFLRFPKLKQVSEYRKKAVEILINLKKYIEKVEGELK